MVISYFYRLNMGKRRTVTYQGGATSTNDIKHKVSAVEFAKRAIASRTMEVGLLIDSQHLPQQSRLSSKYEVHTAPMLWLTRYNCWTARCLNWTTCQRPEPVMGALTVDRAGSSAMERNPLARDAGRKAGNALEKSWLSNGDQTTIAVG